MTTKNGFVANPDQYHVNVNRALHMIALPPATGIKANDYVIL